MDKVYEQKGILAAKRLVAKYYLSAKIRENGKDVIIVDDRTGKALSPVCCGEGPAWRFAGLMIHMCHQPFQKMPNFLEDTLIEVPNV
ncbi:MAG: hypothetical protein ACRYGG_18215 [Janthinobacterium lividum]